MISVSRPALRYLVETCQEQPGCFAGVLIDSVEAVKQCYDDALDFVDWCVYAKSFINPGHTCALISFKNGNAVIITNQVAALDNYDLFEIAVSNNVDTKTRKHISRKY